MLVLSRRCNEASVFDAQVRIGIVAPATVRVLREEVFPRDQKDAAGAPVFSYLVAMPNKDVSS